MENAMAKDSKLTGRDVIIALGWHRHLDRVDNDLANYWHLRFKLLSRSLGLPAGWNDDHSRTPRMINLLVEEVIKTGFFSGFLEYTPLSGEREIFKRNRDRIKTAEANLRDRLLDYAEELLLQFWPEIRGKAVDVDQLVSLGLPIEQPNPIDYM
jgi:hypothetical protein